MDGNPFGQTVEQDDKLILDGVGEVYVAFRDDRVTHLETLNGELQEYILPSQLVPSGICRRLPDDDGE